MSEPTTEKNLLDLTSDEALDFLFPKPVSDGLKQVAKPETETFQQTDEEDDVCLPDSLNES